jgi:hypothetical protein
MFCLNQRLGCHFVLEAQGRIFRRPLEDQCKRPGFSGEKAANLAGDRA